MSDITNQIIGAESGGNPTATNPNSSAAGLGQFIDPTWLATVKQHAPDVAQGKSDDEILALKNNPQLAALPENQALARQMTNAYASDNQAVLAKNGLPVTPGSTYLAHFAGPGGAVKVMQADPNTPVENLLTPAAIKANPFLKGMTASGLQAWADRTVNKQAPGQPTQLASAPPQNPPIFAPPSNVNGSGAPAQNSPNVNNNVVSRQSQQSVGGGTAYQPFVDAKVTPPPIFAPAPRQIDLSALRAQLAAAQQTPLFANQGNGNV